jgi:hypothetical protein
VVLERVLHQEVQMTMAMVRALALLQETRIRTQMILGLHREGQILPGVAIRVRMTKANLLEVEGVVGARMVTGTVRRKHRTNE